MRKYTSIEKNKFEEERVRLILTYLKPERYKGAVLSESPDIVCTDNGIGVEVTSCRKSDHMERDSIVGKMTGKRIADLSEKEKKLIRRGDVFADSIWNGRILAGYTAWGEEYDVRPILQRKLKKLNTNYQKYKENELFITAWRCDDDELGKILQQIREVNFSAEFSFSRIYFCRNKNEHVEVYELNKDSQRTLLIDRKTMDGINIKAKSNTIKE
jgi:hypothetical protein